MPSFDQLRSSFLLDRINGSHSLTAYAWGERNQGFLTDMELQSYYRAIVSMFRRLEPILRQPGKPVPVTSSHEFVASGVFQDGTDQVIIIVNISGDTPADITFAFPASAADNYFDPQWKYAPSNGKYHFRLGPNGSKVLRLKNK